MHSPDSSKFYLSEKIWTGPSFTDGEAETQGGGIIPSVAICPFK